MAAALLPEPAGRKMGIGVIFDMGQHDGMLMQDRRLRGGIEIPHNEVRNQTQALHVAIAGVTGDKEIARLQIPRHLRLDGHRRKDDRPCGRRPAGRALFGMGHRSHSFRWLASSYMAR